MSRLLLCAMLFVSDTAGPPFFTPTDYFRAKVDQCIEDHRDRSPDAPDISTTCSTDTECEDAELYCYRAIASGCSDPDDYSYSTCEGVL